MDILLAQQPVTQFLEHARTVFSDPENIKNGILIFTSILYEALPFIVLGAILAGVLEVLVPQSLITRLIEGLERRLPPALARFAVILVGGLLGVLFPMCECGIITVMRRLLRKGVPLSCCVAYMLAGPIVNVVVAISTFTAFGGFTQTGSSATTPGQLGGWGMLAARMFFGYLVAIGTALIVEWQFQRHGYKLVAPGLMPEKMLPAEDGDNGNGRPRRTAWQAVSAIAETTLHDFVDITVFLIIGALLAALVRVLLPHQAMTDLANQHWYASILVMMGLAIVLCLCSEADAFVAASFGAVRASAKVGFLVLGPMLDFKLFFMYLRVFRPRLIATIMLSVVVQVFLYSVLFHLWWEGSLSQFFSSRGS
jgi:uncharacterized membrane protein YraQ (UPF0718 family)